MYYISYYISSLIHIYLNLFNKYSSLISLRMIVLGFSCGTLGWDFLCDYVLNIFRLYFTNIQCSIQCFRILFRTAPSYNIGLDIYNSDRILKCSPLRMFWNLLVIHFHYFQTRFKNFATNIPILRIRLEMEIYFKELWPFTEYLTSVLLIIITKLGTFQTYGNPERNWPKAVCLRAGSLV